MVLVDGFFQDLQHGVRVANGILLLPMSGDDVGTERC